MHRRDNSIVIVTPALAEANNGNWQTAQRWAGMLRPLGRVRITREWQADDAADESLMIALHARRSAAAVAAWKRHWPGRPAVVVLTGTDLYRDIECDADARISLDLADRLIVLNEIGAAALPTVLRSKTRVVLQSCSARRPLPKPGDRLRALMVGHLRDEKAPQTYFGAAEQLADRPDIRLDHIGAALDETLGERARALMARHPTYRWLGATPHATVRRRIQAAHVLVHPSRLEGGANVVVEALRSGTPVLASRIDGNVGLLGDGYAGYFPVGDAAALAAALRRLRDDAAMLDHLRSACAALAGRYSPACERTALHAAVGGLAVLSRGPPHDSGVAR